MVNTEGKTIAKEETGHHPQHVQNIKNTTNVLCTKKKDEFSTVHLTITMLPSSVKRIMVDFLNARESTRLACTCRSLRCVELLDPTPLKETNADFYGGYTICPRRWQWILFQMPLLNIHTAFVKSKSRGVGSPKPTLDIVGTDVNHMEKVGLFPDCWEYNSYPQGVRVSTKKWKECPKNVKICQWKPTPNLDYSIWSICGGGSDEDPILHIRNLEVRELVYKSDDDGDSNDRIIATAASLLLKEGEDTKSSSTPELVDQLVEIQGLVGRKDLNGRVGRVVKWHPDQGRWQVRLNNNNEAVSTIGIKPENLIYSSLVLKIRKRLELYYSEEEKWEQSNKCRLVCKDPKNGISVYLGTESNMNTGYTARDTALRLGLTFL
mmetsp:Transcript_18903/g.21662  ORF Transcript_18903/g.21662 Transcript_18903/m.21662 type:complete len:378 (+) Transcript_18903:38-1171(+)